MDAVPDLVVIRRRAGLTQKQLADLSGVAQPNVAAYESGSRRPSAKMLARLIAAAKPRPSLALATHKTEVTDILRLHKAVDVRVFGSVARGDDVPGSDVDLLVRFSPKASLFDQVQLAQDLQDLLGVRVDVVSEAGLRDGHDEIRAQARPL